MVRFIVIFWTHILLIVFSFSVQAADPVRVALAFSSVANLNDKSFISAINRGAERAKHDFHIELSSFVQTKAENDKVFLESVAQKPIDVLIALSFVDASTILDCTEKYQHVKFLMVDGVVAPLFTNAKSVIFRDQEGAFLMGMIAALKSKTGKIGFIGGRDIPIIHNFEYGFQQGAQYVNHNILILEDIIGEDVSAWDSPEKAAKLANYQYDHGVDIIFAAAGASGLGVLKTAAARDRLAIGVDSNQNGLYPGHVLTSMVKKVDVAIYEALRDLSKGKWDPGILNLGLAEKAMDYTVDSNNRKLLDEATLGIVENARRQIISGDLKVKMYSPY